MDRGAHVSTTSASTPANDTLPHPTLTAVLLLQYCTDLLIMGCSVRCIAGGLSCADLCFVVQGGQLQYRVQQGLEALAIVAHVRGQHPVVAAGPAPGRQPLLTPHQLPDADLLLCACRARYRWAI